MAIFDQRKIEVTVGATVVFSNSGDTGLRTGVVAALVEDEKHDHLHRVVITCNYTGHNNTRYINSVIVIK